MKKNNGITLIALIITIIIMLILVAVTVSILINSGLIGKAKEAEDKTRTAYTEESRLGDNINIDGKVYNGIDDFYNTEIKENITYPVYTLGEEVTIGEEKFFVITENDDSSKDSITVITKYYLSITEVNKQHDDTFYGESYANFCSDPNGSSSGYWSSIEGITYPYDLNDIQSDRAIAINKAKAYGESKGGTGRLLTKEEAVNLSSKIEAVILGTYCSLGNMRYYLSTAQNYQNLFYVDSENYERGYYEDYAYFGFSMCGIRPVITVPKSNIQT